MADSPAGGAPVACESIQNLPALLFEQAAARPDAPLLWARRDKTWQPLTRREVAEQVRALAAGLRGLGLDPGERVVLVAENRPEFLIADLAVMTAGGVTVPAYTTNTEADHVHVLDDSEAAIAIASTADLAKRLLPAAARCETCRHAVTIEPVTGHEHETPVLHLWAEVLDQGRAKLAAAGNGYGPFGPEPGRDDLATLIYTSGTGGLPKGVMLTHGNILANCASIHPLLDEVGVAADQEVFLSFLPLSHAYERTAGQFFPLTIGAEIYYSRGVEHLATEMGEVRPTIMTAVPRLFELLNQRIQAGLRKQPRWRQRLFARAETLGRRRLAGRRLDPLAWIQDRLLERMVRAKVRGRFGGRLKGMVSGGAALSPELGRTFIALGLRVIQGYGQTEAAPIIAFNPPSRVKMDTVGKALPGVTVALAPDNELLVKGPNVMKGYWNLPEHTAGTIRDGWLYTGDLARIDDEGYIAITDRKKDIVVLSGGDTLSPARVENALTRQPEVAQAMVYGDKRPHLVALIVPDEDFAREWAAAEGLPPDLASLARESAFHARLDAVLRRVNQQVNQMERVRRFTIAPEPFSVDNEMLTPTLKIRRHKIREAYGEALDALY
jgi:long-chain acyl-CoA synthetase